MIVEEGQLKGLFRGFRNRDTIFEFYRGQRWKQADYKSHYYYSYMPQAKVILDEGRFILQVDGMGDSVVVRRI